MNGNTQETRDKSSNSSSDVSIPETLDSEVEVQQDCSDFCEKSEDMQLHSGDAKRKFLIA